MGLGGWGVGDWYLGVVGKIYKSFYRVLKTKSTTSSRPEASSAPDT